MALKLVAKRPAPAPAPEWSFPEISSRKLNSGLTLLAVNTPGRPLATARLIFEAGVANEEQNLAGVAFVTAESMLEGTNTHKGPAFMEAVESLGASLFTNVGWDSFELILTAPVNRLEPAMELMSDAIREPAFRGSDVYRVSKQRGQAIYQEYAFPQGRAGILFNKTLYSEKSPYSRPVHGSFWSVAAAGKRQVKKYHKTFVTPGSATLIVVGDLEGLPIDKIVDKAFGDWSESEPTHMRPFVEEKLNRNVVALVHREDAEQSALFIGHGGASRKDPEYLAIVAMNAVLGGLFNSRINTTLREEKGYTYGAGSFFSFRREAGPFGVQMGVDTEKTIDAIDITLKILEKMQAKGVTKDELAIAKGYLEGVYRLQFETPTGIAGGIANQVVYGLGDDYWNTYEDSVRALTLDDVNKVASERIHPDRLAIAVVGDSEKLARPLKDADFGPLSVIKDPKGSPPD
jgi:predicted Zn-dependent peptidase